MKVPDAAIEAAAMRYALSEPTEPTWLKCSEALRRGARKQVRMQVEAAAPHIAAQALRDAASVLFAEVIERVPVGYDESTHSDYAAWLCGRADALAPPSDRATEEDEHG